MVYDESRNFIGDTHWKDSEPVQEGEELTLDRGGVLVQVEDQVGSSETDLTPLFERNKAKDFAERSAKTGGLSATARLTLGGRTAPPPTASGGLLKHRSLNALLGTPKGALGRATLPKSPYEQRHGTDENAAEECRSPKRLRTSTGTPARAWNVTRTTKTQSTTNKDLPLWAKTSDDRTARLPVPATKKKPRSTNGQPRFSVRQVIDITSDHDVEIEQTPASDVTLPSTPQKLPTATPTLKSRYSASSSAKKKAPSPALPPEPGSPPVSNKNRVTNVEATPEKPEEPFEDLSDVEKQAERERTRRKAKPLQLAKSQPRNMLVCRNVQTKKKAPKRPIPAEPIEIHSDSGDDARFTTVSEIPPPSKKAKKNKPPAASGKDKPRPPAKSKKKFAAAQQSRHDETQESSPAFSTMPARTPRRPPPAPPPNEGDMAIDLGIMDQQLITNPIPHPRIPPPKQTDSPFDRDHTCQSSPTATRHNRPFRRIQSENNAAVPPLSFPPDAFSTLHSLSEEGEEPSDIDMLKPPTRRKTAIKRSFSDNHRAGNARKQIEPRNLKGKSAGATSAFKAVVKPKPTNLDVGPWSTDALDLFDWRPPDWEERVRKKGEQEADMVVA
jgi:Protein of unknown function (DUF2439)